MQALENAMQDLKGESFKLWVYFSKNQDNYSFDLSQKAAEQCGIKRTSYYNHIETLIEKGYLQQKNENSNIFFFTETAFSEIWKEREDKEIIITENWKEYSENRKEFSVNKIEISEIQQRNNINNIKIQQNNIKEKSGKAAKKNYEEECENLLTRINEDREKGKFNQRQLNAINYLLSELDRNRSEPIINQHAKILRVYNALYNK